MVQQEFAQLVPIQLLHLYLAQELVVVMVKMVVMVVIGVKMEVIQEHLVMVDRVEVQLKHQMQLS